MIHYNEEGDLEIICNGCKKSEVISGWNMRDAKKYHPWVRSDAYGIYTGIYCDKCYNSDIYPYRKDKYETMENDGYGDWLGEDDDMW